MSAEKKQRKSRTGVRAWTFYVQQVDAPAPHQYRARWDSDRGTLTFWQNRSRKKLVLTGHELAEIVTGQKMLPLNLPVSHGMEEP